ncbi:hypothetical protein Ddye_009259 [Dipteronia dyeriana]|uniref:Transposase n=1 Tax=Dipteronia dyeriana TaxID=168575 RepID=A0AAD9XBF1_9ROSI|nr:hypothetical protein Ddye_009259 [Dipteronia dyeriana]
MVGARTDDGEQPQCDLDDTEILFSFMVHHGGGYDGEMENYIGGKIIFFNYLNLDELSMLDLDDIALELGYKLPVGFWIQVSGCGKPLNINCDQAWLSFGDKIPPNRVLDLFLEPIEALQTIRGDEVIHYQHLESHNDCAEADLHVSGLNEENVDELNGKCGERDNLQRKDKGKHVLKEAESETVDRDNLQRKDKRKRKSLQFTDIPRPESGDASDIDEGSEKLNRLDGSDNDEIQRGFVSQFRMKKYHEFNPSCDMQDPKFVIGMEFGNADVFRNDIRAHTVKNKRAIRFKKNDRNRIKAICENDGCKWFVYGSWLTDKRTFKIKSIGDEHTCAMTFTNKFVNSKMIANKPILGLDGCHTKVVHNGQLLTAVGVDPNNQMYLVAYALMESEYRDTWVWFLQLLAVDLEINNSYGIVWISDKQKGFI